MGETRASISEEKDEQPQQREQIDSSSSTMSDIGLLVIVYILISILLTVLICQQKALLDNWHYNDAHDALLQFFGGAKDSIDDKYEEIDMNEQNQHEVDVFDHEKYNLYQAFWFFNYYFSHAYMLLIMLI